MVICHTQIKRDSHYREDSSKIFVAVGYGFFVELTHAEALKFIEKKTNQLTAWVEVNVQTESFVSWY